MWRACNLTAFTPCLTSPVDYPFASRHEGPRFNPRGGTYMKTGWAGPLPEPSLGHRADNVIIPLDLTQLFCPGFTLAAGPPSSFATDIVGCLGGALWRACNLTALYHVSLVQWTNHLLPAMRDPGSIPRGVLKWNRGFPVCIVSLQAFQLHLFFYCRQSDKSN
jgi:hypothetical protein